MTARDFIQCASKHFNASDCCLDFSASTLHDNAITRSDRPACNGACNNSPSPCDGKDVFDKHDETIRRGVKQGKRQQAAGRLNERAKTSALGHLIAADNSKPSRQARRCATLAAATKESHVLIVGESLSSERAPHGERGSSLLGWSPFRHHSMATSEWSSHETALT